MSRTTTKKTAATKTTKKTARTVTKSVDRPIPYTATEPAGRNWTMAQALGFAMLADLPSDKIAELSLLPFPEGAVGHQWLVYRVIDAIKASAAKEGERRGREAAQELAQDKFGTGWQSGPMVDWPLAAVVSEPVFMGHKTAVEGAIATTQAIYDLLRIAAEHARTDDHGLTDKDNSHVMWFCRRIIECAQEIDRRAARKAVA